MSLQDKFEVIVPYKKTEDDGNSWVSQSSVRDLGETASMHFNNQTADDCCPYKFNFTPPGMDISNQKRAQIENMPLSMAGSTDVSGQVNFKGDKIFKYGFHRQEMNGTDDLYSGEHIDLFYSEAVGEDDTGERYEGFCERNNYLDRN